MMLPLAFVLVGENFFEPVSLVVGNCFVHEYGIVKDREFFTATVTPKSTHLRGRRVPVLSSDLS